MERHVRGGQAQLPAPIRHRFDRVCPRIRGRTLVGTGPSGPDPARGRRAHSRSECRDGNADRRGLRPTFSRSRPRGSVALDFVRRRGRRRRLGGRVRHHTSVALPFWLSDAVLISTQASLIALPAAPHPAWMERLRGAAWALVPVASICVVVGVIALAPGAADVLTYLALIATPL